jgi:hypothetical protein
VESKPKENPAPLTDYFKNETCERKKKNAEKIPIAILRERIIIEEEKA